MPAHRSPNTTALLFAALAATTLLTPLAPSFAQLAPNTPAASVQTPMGRAPLSFADIVERVATARLQTHVRAGAARHLAAFQVFLICPTTTR
jgi:hypothetical protein